MGTFLAIDRHLRSAVFTTLTGFNLNKNYILAINGNNIDFFTIGTPITFQNLISIIKKILDCQVFADLTQ